jgi:hypothetical protein
MRKPLLPDEATFQRGLRELARGALVSALSRVPRAHWERRGDARRPVSRPISMNLGVGGGVARPTEHSMAQGVCPSDLPAPCGQSSPAHHHATDARGV